MTKKDRIVLPTRSKSREETPKESGVMSELKALQLSGDEPVFLIDSPSPFAPKVEWQEFLAELKSLERRAKSVVREIKLAERHIRRLSLYSH
jgi:hypothetical protein